MARKKRYKTRINGTRVPKVLEESEQVRLALLAQSGCTKSRNVLLRTNRGFVVQVARRYDNGHLDIDELIQNGLLGLNHAIDKYEHHDGTKFLSYAVWWIRVYITMAMSSETRVVSIPANKIQKYPRVTRAYESLQQELQREPTIEEVVDRCGFPRDIVEVVYSAVGQSISLDAPLSMSGEPYGEIVAGEPCDVHDRLLVEDTAKACDYVLSGLSERDRLILEAYYGMHADGVEMTLADIGRMLGCSRENVRMSKERAIAKLQKRFGVCKGVASA